MYTFIDIGSRPYLGWECRKESLKHPVILFISVFSVKQKR